LLVALMLGADMLGSYVGVAPERSDLLSRDGSLFQVVRKRWVLSDGATPLRVNVYLERLGGNAANNSKGE
jgi:hypothetical protein